MSQNKGTIQEASHSGKRPKTHQQRASFKRLCTPSPRLARLGWGMSYTTFMHTQPQPETGKEHLIQHLALFITTNRHTWLGGHSTCTYQREHCMGQSLDWHVTHCTIAVICSASPTDTHPMPFATSLSPACTAVCISLFLTPVTPYHMLKGGFFFW